MSKLQTSHIIATALNVVQTLHSYGDMLLCSKASEFKQVSEVPFYSYSIKFVRCMWTFISHRGKTFLAFCLTDNIYKIKFQYIYIWERKTNCTIHKLFLDGSDQLDFPVTSFIWLDKRWAAYLRLLEAIILILFIVNLATSLCFSRRSPHFIWLKWLGYSRWVFMLSWIFGPPFQKTGVRL